MSGTFTKIEKTRIIFSVVDLGELRDHRIDKQCYVKRVPKQEDQKTAKGLVLGNSRLGAGTSVLAF